MEQVRTITSSLAMVAIAFGLSACTGVETPPTITSSAQVGPQIPARSSPQISSDDTRDFKAIFENFTTEGKPTKTIETPWGAREVYDMNKDVLVRQAIEIAYHQKGQTFWDITEWRGGSTPSPFEYTKYPVKHYLRQANIVSYLDLVRLGCTEIVRPICRPTPYQILQKPSGTQYLGQVKRSQEERINYPFKPTGTQGFHSSGNFHFVLDEEKDEIGYYTPIKTRLEINGEYRNIVGRVDVGSCAMNKATNKPIDQRYILPHGQYYIGAVSDYSVEETWEMATKFQCDQWNETDD